MTQSDEHRSTRNSVSGILYCIYDGEDWPCKTTRNVMLSESVYEEVAALRRLVALADAMYAEMHMYQQAEHDAFYFVEFGHDGPSLAGALDGADRQYVYHRHEEGRRLGLPDAMTALGQRPSVERRARTAELRDRFIQRVRYALPHFGGTDDG